jgi:spore coat polysaccharide biosynthesis predicted glycosyltransferase SpsG/CMP-N-acetylneuraminic acid synthetase
MYYAISAARTADGVADVVVDTDDDEIAMFAERFGARVQRRPSELAADDIPLDPVVAHSVDSYEKCSGHAVDLVITVQPTSPLVQSSDLEEAIRLLGAGAASVISVVDDRHLTWTRKDGQLVPEYRERVNRQSLPERFRETGSVIGCVASGLRTHGTRIVEPISLLVVPPERSVDIDTYQDFAVADFLLRRKNVAFVVVGNRELGLGHAYRALMIAHELVDHECAFWCLEGSEMAADMLAEHNFPVRLVPNDGSLLSELREAQPDLVINDRLDTTADYVVEIKKLRCAVVNFEDLGHGAEVADLVFNALYPHQLPHAHIRVGERYFCLRDEFLHGLDKRGSRPRDEVVRVLITFGGTDEANLTLKVLDTVSEEVRSRRILVDIVTGPGYAHIDELNRRIRELLASGHQVELNASTRRISEHMAAADVAFSSAGRTVFELTSLAVPTVVLCQNKRETTHTFASPKNGFVNLGLGPDIDPSRLLGTFRLLLDDPGLRGEMMAKMSRVDLQSGKARVIREILRLVETGNN